MLLTRKRAYARAGLVGNPSDGYHGKTHLAHRPQLPGRGRRSTSGTRSRSCSPRTTAPRSARSTTWPATCGCTATTAASGWSRRPSSGSSSTARRAGADAARPQLLGPLPDDDPAAGRPGRVERDHRRHAALPDGVLRRAASRSRRSRSFVLSVEQEELGIAAGLQDRVIQVYEGLVYMDFDSSREHVVDGLRCYRYEPLDPALLPPLYVAHHETLSEPTEVFHNDIRERFNRGDEAVVGGDEALRRPGGRRPRGAARRGTPSASRASSTRTSTRGAASTTCRLAGPDGRDRAALRRQREVRRFGRRDSGDLSAASECSRPCGTASRRSGLARSSRRLVTCECKLQIDF